eukprot:COSAG06_NODE_682_length_13115_cov_17.917793_10_plen_327_part_00
MLLPALLGQVISSGQLQRHKHVAMLTGDGHDCVDPAARGTMFQDEDQTPYSEAARNYQCQYSCSDLARYFDIELLRSSNTLTCYGHGVTEATQSMPGGSPLNKGDRVQTFTPPEDTSTIIQGHSNVDGSSRTPLNTRLRVLDKTLVALRHVQMVDLTAVQEGDTYSFYRVGGAIYVYLGQLSVEFCVFRGNQAVYSGGALELFLGSHDKMTLIRGTLFEGNVAGLGHKSGSDGGWGGENIADRHSTPGGGFDFCQQYGRVWRSCVCRQKLRRQRLPLSLHCVEELQRLPQCGLGDRVSDCLVRLLTWTPTGRLHDRYRVANRRSRI